MPNLCCLSPVRMACDVPTMTLELKITLQAAGHDMWSDFLGVVCAGTSSGMGMRERMPAATAIGGTGTGGLGAGIGGRGAGTGGLGAGTGGEGVETGGGGEGEGALGHVPSKMYEHTALGVTRFVRHPASMLTVAVEVEVPFVQPSKLEMPASAVGLFRYGLSVITREFKYDPDTFSSPAVLLKNALWTMLTFNKQRQLLKLVRLVRLV